MTIPASKLIELPSRRQFCATLAATASAVAFGPATLAADSKKKPRLNYILSSAMYGYTALEEILPEVKKTGATAIDIWPKVHGNQREQINEMGLDRFAELLRKHDIRLGTLTSYALGPFKLQKEMHVAKQLGGDGVVLVCAARGPRDLTGDDLKSAVGDFVEKMKPHVEVAEATGCTIAIENHSNNLIHSRDSILWFAELAKSDRLGLAFAPHHLPQDSDMIAKLAGAVGPKVYFFYAQQHGKGSREKLPQNEMLTQMPGRGPLDFAPILLELLKTGFQGYTEIFMHPVPRGIPILDSTAAITEEINRSRDYLNKCLEQA
ncbi:MAG: sugar phosphate isomerase/epimerase [Planctomycetes bacterium]|nr:sugar phosphate isomerase/epimerase [Planctomycetota bacterium]